MANYYGVCRSNYFAVKSEAAFRKLISHCSSEDEIHIFERDGPGGKLFGFGCYGSIPGLCLDEDGCSDQTAFYRVLKKIVAEGHAVIITEAGYEKLRYVVGGAAIITNRAIKYLDINNRALITARIMLGNPDYAPVMNY